MPHVVTCSPIISDTDRGDKVEEDLSCFYATEVGIFLKTLLVTFGN